MLAQEREAAGQSGVAQRRSGMGVLMAAGLAAVIFAAPAQAACQNISEQNQPYAVCIYPAKGTDIRTFLAGENGEVFGSLSALDRELHRNGERLAMAMNGGMYHSDLSPVGLYVENGAQRQGINTRRGPGNFHMLPNGVFYVANGVAGVMETRAFMQRKIRASFATQSGPMLVINGRLHPRFDDESDSRKMRNGVGVCDGGRVVFAISERYVTFHEFAELFRSRFKCSNALFLDGGGAPVLHAPSINRADRGRAIGPIVGVVERKRAR